MGIGKLYRFSDDQFVANVDYQLFHHEAATNWCGELSLIDSVRLSDGDKYIIEFEDKRKSRCYLKKRVNRAVSGIPPHYIYHVTGFSLLPDKDELPKTYWDIPHHQIETSVVLGIEVGVSKVYNP